MGCLHLGVRGPAISDVLCIEQAEGLDRYLVNLSGKATDAGPGRQLVEAAHAVVLGQESNEHGLHDQTSLEGEPLLNGCSKGGALSSSWSGLYAAALNPGKAC